MATPSGAISSALPIRTFPSFPQSWNKWSIPPVETAIIGLIGAVFICTIYLMIRGVSSSPRKIPTTYFPPEKLSASGFIKIFSSCIGETCNVVEVKAMIEDAKGQRIATRYLPRFDVNADIFAQLPPNQNVFVRLKVTREDQGQQVTKQVLPRIKLRVNHEIGAYSLPPGKVSCTSALTLFESNRPYNLKIFQSFSVKCDEVVGSSVGMSTYRYRTIDQRENVSVESYDNCYKLFRINLFINLGSTQIKAPLYYYMDCLGTRTFQLKSLFKDWKAAYKQETGSRIYQVGGGNDVIFNIQDLSYSTYLWGKN